MTHLVRSGTLYMAIAFASVAIGQELTGGPQEQLIKSADQAQLRGDYDEAIQILSQALDRNTAFHEALLRRANTLRITGKYKQAVADYEAILHLRPPMAWHGFADLLATCPDEECRDGVRAEKLATKALKYVQARYPDSQAVPELMDTLAAACAQQGKFEEAVRWEKNAIQLSHHSRHDDMRSRLLLYEAGKPYFKVRITSDTERD